MQSTRKHVRLSVSLPQEVRDQIRQAAFDENVSVSAWISRRVRQHLQREAYLSCPASLLRGPAEPHQRHLFPHDCY